MVTDASGEVHAAAPARQDLVLAVALFSLAAGFLHAAVIDAHRGHGWAAQVFAITAVAQIGWAAWVMTRPTRPVLTVGAVLNGLLLLGWVLSRSRGLPLLDGFEEKEPVGTTDGITAGLEALAVLGAAGLVLVGQTRRLWPAGRLGAASLSAVGLAVALISVPAMAGADEHAHGDADHAAGDEHAHAEGDDHAEGNGHEESVEASVVNTDTGHATIETTADITPAELAAAEALLNKTIHGLWQWADEEKVYEAGFRTIGDGPTGTEHLVNWNWINDDVVLDPDHPESLVYRTLPGGKRVLEAAMYMAPQGTVSEDLPDVGGVLTQWHIHDNLCYTPAEVVDGFPQRFVTGVTGDGTCRNGEYLSPHAPMLHVWVVPHECGPFASLEGVGAGQAVAEEQDPNADPACNHSAH